MLAGPVQSPVEILAPIQSNPDTQNDVWDSWSGESIDSFLLQVSP